MRGGGTRVTEGQGLGAKREAAGQWAQAAAGPWCSSYQCPNTRQRGSKRGVFVGGAGVLGRNQGRESSTTSAWQVGPASPSAHHIVHLCKARRADMAASNVATGLRQPPNQAGQGTGQRQLVPRANAGQPQAGRAPAVPTGLVHARSFGDRFGVSTAAGQVAALRSKLPMEVLTVRSQSARSCCSALPTQQVPRACWSCAPPGST